MAHSRHGEATSLCHTHYLRWAGGSNTDACFARSRSLWRGLSERQTSESPPLPGDLTLKIDLNALGNAALGFIQ